MKNFKPTGLNHITLRVNEIERAEEFYGEFLGFEQIKKMGRSMAVYQVGTDTIVLVEAETSFNRDSKDYRVDHFGFRVKGPEVVDEVAAFMKEREVTILSGPSNRKNGRFVFISDPDGNMIEIYSE